VAPQGCPGRGVHLNTKESDAGAATKLQDVAARQAAYAARFSNTNYTGNYWNYIPLPASKPSGFWCSDYCGLFLNYVYK
jgi:hypothetical protein